MSNRLTRGNALLGKITGKSLKVPMAEGDLVAGPEVILEFDVADHATQNVDKVITNAMVVTDAWVIANSTNGANANTVQLDNGVAGAHITDAMSTNGKVAGNVVRAASIFPANWSLAAGATLRIIQTKAGGTHAFKVVVTGYLK